ncbi:MAG: inositol monophosphatase [Acetatifactor muris]|nr:inositol monophosphatase [Acetatifactor muris]MCM1525659.1 inositol monophosphatase [Bacteroides sp.]
MNPVDVDILKVTEIVREAGELMQNRRIQVMQKGNDSNYVTSCDIAVERFLSGKLRKLLPESLVIGEESDHNPSDGDILWVIDPIDGTSNFIRDIGISAISVGLVQEGEPFLGVVYQPYRDEMFYAKKGEGAYLNGRRIHVSDRDFAHSHLCSAMSLYDKRYAPPCFRIIDRIYREADDLRRLGSAAVELVYLACGRVELYFEIRLFPWDAAGAIPIIREAGGSVEALYEKSLPLDRPFPVIAANTAENFARLKSIVTEEIPEIPWK